MRCGRVQPQEHLLAGMLQGDCAYRGLLQHCLAAPMRSPVHSLPAVQRVLGSLLPPSLLGCIQRAS